MTDFTQLLNDVDPANAIEVLLPLVYDELRRMAAEKLARENPGHTLQPTALVHEVYLRMLPAGDGASPQQTFANRAHFFAAAAESMRRILIDEARKKLSAKRGGNLHRIDFNEHDFPEETSNSSPGQLLALDEVLHQFETIDPQKAQLVKLRYFAGLTLADAADVLGISLATAKRYWVFARAWLFGKLKSS